MFMLYSIRIITHTHTQETMVDIWVTIDFFFIKTNQNSISRKSQLWHKYHPLFPVCRITFESYLSLRNSIPFHILLSQARLCSSIWVELYNGPFAKNCFKNRLKSAMNITIGDKRKMRCKYNLRIFSRPFLKKSN